MRKVRSHLDMKRKNGEYIGAFVAYGYQKDPEDKNSLITDEYAAGVVRDIFSMKLQGMSQHSIAAKLNRDGIPSPLEYMQSHGVNLNTSFQKQSKTKWTHASVLRILQNEMYIGTLIQGKTGTPNYKIKKRVEKPEESWVKIENSHEAIIPRSDFLLVQELLLRDTRIPHEAEKLYPFFGTVFCADCGAPMVRKPVTSGGRKYVYYVCSENKRNSAVCSLHRIVESVLSDAVLQAVTEHIEEVLSLGEAYKLLEDAPRTAAEDRKYDDRIKSKTEEVEHIKRRKLRLYEDLKDGILSKDEYEQLKAQYSESIADGEKGI